MLKRHIFDTSHVYGWNILFVHFSFSHKHTHFFVCSLFHILFFVKESVKRHEWKVFHFYLLSHRLYTMCSVSMLCSATSVKSLPCYRPLPLIMILMMDRYMPKLLYAFAFTFSNIKYLFVVFQSTLKCFC